MRLSLRVTGLLLAAPLAVTGIAGLTACSASTPTTSASGTSASATSATSSGATQAGSGVDTSTFIDMLTRGLKSAKTYTMKLDMVTTAAGKTVSTTMTGAVDLSDSASPAMTISMTLPAGTASAAGPMEMILLDRIIYLKMGGTSYLKLDAATIAKQTGSDPFASMSSPAEQLSKQASSIKKVTLVGEEDVTGVATKHYSIVLDLKAAAAVSGKSLPSSPALDQNVPYDVWIDGQDHTRKFTMTMTTSPEAATVKDTVVMAGTMDKFGEPVSITAPPASQVMTMPSLPAS